MARRQLWVRPGSSKDVELQRLVRESANARGGRWALERHASKIGIVTWQPVSS